MQDSLYRFSLDIHSTQSQVSIPVPQFDTARGICATLTEAGKPYQISDGCHAVFSATKADGTMILNDCIIVNSSIIRYDFTEQTTAAVGIVDCSITIYGKNNKVLTSPRFTIVVYEGTRPNDVESKDEKNAIDNLFVTELNRIEAEEHRIAAETARSVAEQDRVNAELMRTAAELGRANSELTRSSAEQNRVNSESVRVEAERNRLNSESIRVEAEWKRVATELARDEAERKRAEAERQRNEVVLIDLVNAAIEEGKKTGVFGKSAYDFAKDGGYSGTAAEFAVDINPDNIKAGATPELGVDYFTDNDQNNITSRVYELIKNGGVVGFVNENNDIILSGNLADGDYTVKYEMEDGSTVGIGNLVLDTNVYYSVTNNLTNCTNNNNITEVTEGESYSATITANSGYELKTVSVTMGGSPVSVSGGIINISNVTGDIVITAVAEEIRVEITNLIPTLTDVDLSTIYNGTGYKENTRISISAKSDSNPTGEKTQAGTTLLGIMPLGNDGDVLHLSGAKFFDNTGGNTYSGIIWYYNASGTLLNTGTINIPSTGLLSTDANGDATFTMTHSKMKLIDGTAYIRLNITNPTGELIMTRNQLIPKD